MFHRLTPDCRYYVTVGMHGRYNLWGVKSVRFCQRKTDPTKRSLWIHLSWRKGPRKGKGAGFFEIHRLPVRILQQTIVEIAEASTDLEGRDNLWLRDCEIALDFLYTELGRRANRKSNVDENGMTRYRKRFKRWR